MLYFNENVIQPKYELKRQHETVRVIRVYALKVMCLLGTTFLFTFGWTFFQSDRITESNFMNLFLLSILFFLIYMIFSRVYNAFDLGTCSVFELVLSQLMAVTISNIIFFILTSLFFHHILNIAGILLSFVFESAWCFLWCVISDRVYQKLDEPKRTAIVYENEDISKIENNLYQYRRKFGVTKTLKAERGLNYIFSNFKDIEVVFIYGVSANLRNSILKYCVQYGIEVYVRPKIEDVILSGSGRLNICDVPVMQCGRNNQPSVYLFIKRIFDIAVSFIGIVLSSPIMIAVAAFIKLYDGGPVFYRQTRLTKDGQSFEILKFRSMSVDAEKDGVARLAGKNDCRITPVGKVIRAIRFDELPQLFNIFKGDMTFVGPRPERPEIAKQYAEFLPEFHLRLQVKAGLTGYAQVYGKYNTTPYNKLQMDLIYIANSSFLEDLKLMFLTAKVLLLPESTEGINDGQVTAQTSNESNNWIL